MLILGTILFAPLTLVFEITEKHLALKIKVFGVRVWALGTASKTKKPDKKKQGNTPKKKSSSELLSNLRLILRIVFSVLKQIPLLPQMRHLRFNLSFGLGDAAATGMAAGGIYGLVYGIQARLYHSKKVRFDEVTVTPDFQSSAFSVTCSGIITTCLAHIMGIAIVALAVTVGEKNKED